MSSSEVLRVDLHVHTDFSQDGVYNIREMIRKAKEIKLDGIAITDHNHLLTKEDARKLSREFDFIVIPGVEGGKIFKGDPSNNTRKHWIVLNADSVTYDRDIVKVLKEARRQGGLTIAPHPLSPDGFANYEALGFDAVEAINASVNHWQNVKIDKIPRVGSTDSHVWSMLGFAWTDVQCSSRSVEDILESISKGKCEPHGTMVPPRYDEIPRLFGLAMRYGVAEPLKRMGFKVNDGWPGA
jgi:predicted metal-dependent phosphoesterase TrpH